MKTKKSLLLGLIMVFLLSCFAGSFIGCDKEDTGFSTDEKLTLNMAIMYDSNAYMTYNQGNKHADGGYLAADGVRYRDGDIKPVWNALGKKFNFDINDLSYAGKYKNLTEQWSFSQAGNFSGIDMINGGGNDIIEEGITNNRFVDLKQYLDKMPNFKKFLDNNSIVKTTIVAGEGQMFYAPYFDGYDDLERMFMMRVDWVQKLLDGSNEPTFDTAATVQTQYTNYMPDTLNKQFTVVKADKSATETITKNYAKNIIKVQNELSTKNGETLTKALRSYIDTTYNNKFGTKRSELFTGVNAAYDADELVALLRCVKANPALLNGNAEANIIPFYPRWSTNDRVMDLMRFMEIWGVRGMDARINWLYIDKEGKLQDARVQQSTMDGLERLHNLYAEGLILPDFHNDNATSGTSYANEKSHRNRLNAQNLGFMTYDYNQTTTVVNKLDETITDFNLTPVLPPFADWGYDNYTRFTDSWRSVKADGWAILASASQAKRERALMLIDYMYSTEGNRLMSFGPEKWIDGTIEYNGKQVPKLSAAALEELQFYAAGNYTNYYRRFLGGTFPIGYVKEQGMEYQCVHPKGQVGLDNILKAIELGTIKHLSVNPNSESDKRLHSMPTTLAYTKTQQTAISGLTLLNTNFTINSATRGFAFSDYVQYGFEGTKGETTLLSKEALITQIETTWNQKLFLTAARAAYSAMNNK